MLTVTVFGKLTEQQSAILNEKTSSSIRGRWNEWLGSETSRVKTAKKKKIEVFVAKKDEQRRWENQSE